MKPTVDRIRVLRAALADALHRHHANAAESASALASALMDFFVAELSHGNVAVASEMRRMADRLTYLAGQSPERVDELAAALADSTTKQ
jgi:hypothetical protein